MKPCREFSLICLSVLFFISPLHATEVPSLQKAKSYTGDENISGWVMSEKLDGIRGVWTGTELLTRKGKTIHAPAWFSRELPPFALDGELWSKRNDFSFIQSAVMDKTPSKDWREITYNVFEVPDAEGNFHQRLGRAEAWFKAHPKSPARVIPQIPCKDKAHLATFLSDIEASGGEGVIVKDPSLPYHTGRTPHVLKVKQAKDMEGVVMKIQGGKGKFEGMMGSLSLRIEDGTEFNLGTGFTDEERRNPPNLGTVVTFRYHGFTSNGKPRFASYLRIRKD